MGCLTVVYKALYTRGVPLTLYRRHLKSCAVHKGRLSARAKRYYIDCQCPIWIYGRTDKEAYPRQSLGMTDWKLAEAERTRLQAKNRSEKIHGKPLDVAVEEYLKSRRPDVTESTHSQIESVLNRLVSYCHAHRVHSMHELNADVLEAFKNNLDGKSTTKSTIMYKVRTFLSHAYRLDWIEKPLVEKLKPVKAVYEQKEPYTDAEVAAILKAAGKLKGGRNGYAGKPQTFRWLLELCVETGIRSGDAVLFDPDNVSKGEHLWVYTYVPQKQKKAEKPIPHDVYLTDRLYQAIMKADWMSKNKPFWYPGVKGEHKLQELVRDRMESIGEKAGIADCTPHRLRHTFAVRLLLKGVPIDEVSRLLGHSSVRITEKYYAKWIPARSRRLEGILAQALLHAS